MPNTLIFKTTQALRRCLSPCALALAFGLAPAMALSQSATVDSPTSRFAQAMQHYESSHWLQAYAELSALADQGHPEAQRISLLMWRHGVALYGTAFSATAAQRRQWAQGQRPWVASR